MSCRFNFLEQIKSGTFMENPPELNYSCVKSMISSAVSSTPVI